MSEMPIVVDAQYDNDYRIRITFNDGSQRTIDFGNGSKVLCSSSRRTPSTFSGSLSAAEPSAGRAVPISLPTHSMMFASMRLEIDVRCGHQCRRHSSVERPRRPISAKFSKPVPRKPSARASTSRKISRQGEPGGPEYGQCVARDERWETCAGDKNRNGPKVRLTAHQHGAILLASRRCSQSTPSALAVTARGAQTWPLDPRSSVTGGKRQTSVLARSVRLTREVRRVLSVPRLQEAGVTDGRVDDSRPLVRIARCVMWHWGDR
jgi:hypothetical protein